MAIETLSQLFDYCVTHYDKPSLQIYRDDKNNYAAYSTQTFKQRVIQFALGLRSLGVQKSSKILVLSENCPEWHVVDFACHLLGTTIVPIFPTLVPEQIEYIVNNSESDFVVVSNRFQLAKIEKIRQKIKRVKKIILFKNIDLNRQEIVLFEQILQLGQRDFDPQFYDAAVQMAKPDDLATIIYTSGTTGVPKGVMLSHRNFIADMLGSCEILPISPADKGLSFLPLSHAFERTVDYAYFYKGVSIIYASKIENVMEDLQRANPTVMASVPRFYEKVKAKVEAKVEETGGLKKRLFDWALSVGRTAGKRRLNDQSLGPALSIKMQVARRLVLSKIKAQLGGSIRYFVSGGAPLSAEVGEFFYAVGLPIVEGYGLTETSPVLSVNPPEKPKFGTVGKVLSCVQVKIADDGEILVKGPNVMLGYYKMPEETKEVMQDGWFHTGDIGYVDEDGYLVITDRKKQLIVTSVGKKVAPQHIEKKLEASKYIDQAVLIGEKRKFISALIVPDFEAIRAYADGKHIDYTSNEDLIQKDEIIALFQQEIDRQQMHLANYQKVKKFTLLAKPFTVEDGQLTPTLKMKRKIILQEHADLIEKMYETI